MVELVMALPVFVLLFAGVFYVRDLAVETQRQDEIARSCAWRYSMNGCTEVPVGCAVHEESPPEIPAGELDDALQNVGNAGASGSGTDGLIQEFVGEIITPMIQNALGRSAVSEPHGEVIKQPIFGGGSHEISARYQLSCNLQKKDPIDIAGDAWSIFYGD